MKGSLCVSALVEYLITYQLECGNAIEFHLSITRVSHHINMNVAMQ